MSSIECRVSSIGCRVLSIGCRVSSIGCRHTSYLSFLLHGQDFRKPNFTPKKTTKITKNTKNVSEKVIYMHFFHSFWKNLHLTENFYTDMSVVSVTNKRYVQDPDQKCRHFGISWHFMAFWHFCQKV